MKKLALAAIAGFGLALLFTHDLNANEGASDMSDTPPVVLINPFIVPEGKVDEAIAAWEVSRDFLAEQPGYISTKLHQSLATDAQYQLINVAVWSSPEAFKAATAAMRASGVFPPVTRSMNPKSA